MMTSRKQALGSTGFEATVLGIGAQVDPSLKRLGMDMVDLHYTLTIGPDVALLGLGFPNEQDAAFQPLESFPPLQPAQMEQLRARAATAIEGKGPCWWNPPH